MTLNLASDVDEIVREVVLTREQEIADKQGRWQLLRVRPYRTIEGNFEGAVMTVIDVDTMRSAREFAEGVVHHLHEPLLVLDSDLRVRIVNAAFCDMFRVAPEQVQGKSLFEVGSRGWDDPGLRRRLTDVLARERRFDEFSFEREFAEIGRRRLRLGAQRLASVDGGGPTVLVAVQDATERERQEQRLSARVDELSTTDRKKSEFLAVLSHELRSPLNAIRGWVQLLQREDARPELVSQAIEAIDRSSRVQSRLIGDLLDVHRLASGKIRLDRSDMNLATVIEEALQSVRPSAEQKGLKLVSELPAQPVVIAGDSSRLHQVFSNLLVNAVKFTGKGEVRIEARARDGVATVRVKDTGAGIAPEVLSQLFEPFRQADPSASRDQGGLGLGLAIARQLVELHGGQLVAAGVRAAWRGRRRWSAGRERGFRRRSGSRRGCGRGPRRRAGA